MDKFPIKEKRRAAYVLLTRHACTPAISQQVDRCDPELLQYYSRCGCGNVTGYIQVDTELEVEREQIDIPRMKTLGRGQGQRFGNDHVPISRQVYPIKSNATTSQHIITLGLSPS